eukprot:NODE_219_length_14015_cov_0.496335.p6 type:complete len:244 gc:universal NODE_219_length_14015_cov_0.496335:9878-10609(+)
MVFSLYVLISLAKANSDMDEPCSFLKKEFSKASLASDDGGCWGDKKSNPNFISPHCFRLRSNETDAGEKYKYCETINKCKSEIVNYSNTLPNDKSGKCKLSDSSAKCQKSRRAASKALQECKKSILIGVQPTENEPCKDKRVAYNLAVERSYNIGCWGSPGGGNNNSNFLGQICVNRREAETDAGVRYRYCKIKTQCASAIQEYSDVLLEIKTEKCQDSKFVKQCEKKQTNASKALRECKESI